jgi:hypothetical protein
MRFDPPISANTYHDGFGNFCHVIRAPAGRLTLSADFLVQDSGAPEAAQHPLESLPVNTLFYLLGICDYVHDRITFGYQHASPTKTAWDADTEPRGVCRDFAHMAVERLV